MTDLDGTLARVPLWLQIAGALGGLGAFVWAMIAAFVRPWHDEKLVRALERCSPAVEKHLREKVFQRELKDHESYDARIGAVEDALKAMAAAQLAQGEALKEIPQLSKVLAKLDGTITTVDRTMEKMTERVEAQGREISEMSGIIKGWREPAADAPQRPRRTRRSS